MKLFGFLAIVLLLAILFTQFGSALKSMTGAEEGEGFRDAMKDQVNEQITGHQKKLDEALQESTQ